MHVQGCKYVCLHALQSCINSILSYDLDWRARGGLVLMLQRFVSQIWQANGLMLNSENITIGKKIGFALIRVPTF